jgi:hypothetical protein
MFRKKLADVQRMIWSRPGVKTQDGTFTENHPKLTKNVEKRLADVHRMILY